MTKTDICSCVSPSPCVCQGQRHGSPPSSASHTLRNPAKLLNGAGDGTHHFSDWLGNDSAWYTPHSHIKGLLVFGSVCAVCWTLFVIILMDCSSSPPSFLPVCSKHPRSSVSSESTEASLQYFSTSFHVSHLLTWTLAPNTWPPPLPSHPTTCFFFTPSQSGVDLGRPHCGLVAWSATSLCVSVTWRSVRPWAATNRQLQAWRWLVEGVNRSHCGLF